MTETAEKPDTLTLVNTRLLREILTAYLADWTRPDPNRVDTYCRECCAVRHHDGCPVEYAIRVMEATS